MLTNSLIDAPQARTYKIDELVSLVMKGTVRIPEFQRPLRWDQADAVRLFDSILKRFPIGSLLLGKGPAAAGRVRLGDVVVDAPKLEDALWVVDGQQRITTLVNVLTQEYDSAGKFHLVLDIKSRPFKIRPARAFESDSIPLPVVFDLKRVLRWVHEHPEAIDLIDDINEVTNAIRNFSVPAYEVRTDDPHILREIFDRMNNTGKKLKKEEVFSALFPSDREGASISGLRDRTTALGWGQIDESTLLQCFLARRLADVNREIRLEFDDERRSASHFPDENQDEAYEGAEAALSTAVAFLRDECGIPHFAFLPYKFAIVVVSRFFALFPVPGSRSIELLRRWVWRALWRGPQKGSATGTTREYSRAVIAGNETESLRRLLLATKETHRAPFDRTLQFRTNTADAKIVLCGLWGRHPRLGSGELFSQEDLADVIGLDTTAAAAVSRLDNSEGLRSDLGNVLLLADHDDWQPITEHYAVEVLQSHLIDKAWDGLPNGEILSLRSEAIASWIHLFLRRMMATGFEDTPNLSSFTDDDE